MDRITGRILALAILSILSGAVLAPAASSRPRMLVVMGARTMEQPGKTGDDPWDERLDGWLDQRRGVGADSV
jgi:hypothetical protein